MTSTVIKFCCITKKKWIERANIDVRRFIYI